MVYIHIPYCRTICTYCDFHHSAALGGVDRMVEAIKVEMQNRRDFVSNPHTFYLGGGTPSVCSPKQVGQLIQLAKEMWKIKNFQEVTLEANPDDLTTEYLEGLLEAGVDRLSIGAQSFIDHHLRKMNRRHNAKQTIQAVKDAYKVGFGNISIDLMFGLPWMTDDEWRSNLQQAIELDTEHISTYHLVIEENTVLGKQGIKPITDIDSQRQFDIQHKALNKAGYEHYEISSFSKPGFRAVHNSGYWGGLPYLGLGPSAHSYDGKRRRHWNISSNKLYMEGDSGSYEILSDAGLHNEYVMTRLRTIEGFSVDEYYSKFGIELKQVPNLNVENGRAFLYAKDFLLSDKVISSLFI